MNIAETIQRNVCQILGDMAKPDNGEQERLMAWKHHLVYQKILKLNNDQLKMLVEKNGYRPIIISADFEIESKVFRLVVARAYLHSRYRHLIMVQCVNDFSIAVQTGEGVELGTANGRVVTVAEEWHDKIVNYLKS